MSRSSIVRDAAVLTAVLLSCSAPAGERSFVKRKLPPNFAYTDTEGHTIRPAHYQGSVLVMMTGIPW
jgi:hypothetical protein